jgi:hypothetical protein
VSATKKSFCTGESFSATCEGDGSWAVWYKRRRVGTVVEVHHRPTPTGPIRPAYTLMGITGTVYPSIRKAGIAAIERALAQEKLV